MQTFKYSARNLSGSNIKGNIEAEDEISLFQILKENGYFPVKVRPIPVRNNASISLLPKIKIKDLSIFTRQLSDVLYSGLTVVEGLELLKNNMENRELKKVVSSTYDEVYKGKSLSQALKESGKLPYFLVNMLEIGEESGQLESMLSKISVYYEREYKIKKKIISALIYPSIICCTAICTVLFLILKVLPMYVNMFQDFNAKLPLPTRILLEISKTIKNNWFLIISTLTISVYGLKYYSTTENGRYRLHKLLLSLPVVGEVNRKIVTSRFASILANLMESGMPVVKSMEVLSLAISNAVVEKGMRRCMEQIKKGESIYDAITSIKIFAPLLEDMIKIGQETGNLPSMLGKAANFYQDEVDTSISYLTALIEPVIIIILSLIIGFVIVSTVLPMFDMYKYMAF